MSSTGGLPKLWMNTTATAKGKRSQSMTCDCKSSLPPRVRAASFTGAFSCIMKFFAHLPFLLPDRKGKVAVRFGIRKTYKPDGWVRPITHNEARTRLYLLSSGVFGLTHTQQDKPCPRHTTQDTHLLFLLCVRCSLVAKLWSLRLRITANAG